MTLRLDGTFAPLVVAEDGNLHDELPGAALGTRSYRARGDRSPSAERTCQASFVVDVLLQQVAQGSRAEVGG